MPKLTLLPREIEEIARRKADLLSRAEAVCEYLAGLGTKEVYIFGSILTDRFDMHSDVDIAVAGMPWEHVYRVESTVEDMLGTEEFHLVYMEYVPDYMVKSIKERGRKYAGDIP
ncbi:MAG: nucleotidyltransferase domain-containing protein [Syntrophorhabdaceae bacterium]|nr:nucleotidyltransferase domain-containing protein [Syntrophorhabdaceae bacterium]MDD4197467.1 nucleotidyltransferase domain-containing protein [Syntrophorhabdaceae bacterium]